MAKNPKEPFYYFLVKDDELKERDDLRRDRGKERQRERNLARAAPDKRSGGSVAGVVNL